MSNYPPIENHGLIGDLQTAALVSTDGTIDWLCLPRFDSPSVFASLVDQEHGGFFRVRAVGEHTVRQMYLPGTPILVTRFMSPDGVGEVIDFMPVAGSRATTRHYLVRLVHVVRGTVRFQAEIMPRFNYGREQPAVELHEAGAVFRGDSMTLTLSMAPEEGVAQDVFLSQQNGGILEGGTLSAGQIGGVVIEEDAQGPPRRVPAAEIRAMFEATRDYWRDWLGRSQYRGRWREEIGHGEMIKVFQDTVESGRAGSTRPPTGAAGGRPSPARR
jgi:GH15 family glucan-1,4-alpha-glucosidase